MKEAPMKQLGEIREAPQEMGLVERMKAVNAARSGNKF